MIDTKATVQDHAKWVAEKIAEAEEIGIRSGMDRLKISHVVAMLFKQNEKLEKQLDAVRNAYPDLIGIEIALQGEKE